MQYDLSFGDTMPKKVLMVIAPAKFRDEELFDTKTALESSGASVNIASKTTDVSVGMLGGKAKPNLALSSAKAADYDAVVFVGGGGAEVYFTDPVALALAKDALAQGKVVSAICIAPSILANAGLLSGKKATVFKGDKYLGILKAKGANYTGRDVEVDGKIITADGPNSAKKFGQAIAKGMG